MIRALRTPDLFITVTANPSWPEITQELPPGQTTSDRPNIVARVFELKYKAILAELKAGVFSKYDEMVWTVEFQKRGLPHRHIILYPIPHAGSRRNRIPRPRTAGFERQRDARYLPRCPIQYNETKISLYRRLSVITETFWDHERASR